MPRIQYQFELQKVVKLIPLQGPPVVVGVVEEYFETLPVPATHKHDPNDPTKSIEESPGVPGKVRVIVNLRPDLTRQQLDKIIANPGLLSITGQTKNAQPAILLPDIEA